MGQILIERDIYREREIEREGEKEGEGRRREGGCVCDCEVFSDYSRP